MTDIATSLNTLSDYAELTLVVTVIEDLKTRVKGLAQMGERKDELLKSLAIAEASAMLLRYEIGIETSPAAKSAIRDYLDEHDVVSLAEERAVRQG